MLDKETVTLQGKAKPGVEEEAFLDCLKRARKQVEDEDLLTCFDRVLDIKNG